MDALSPIHGALGVLAVTQMHVVKGTAVALASGTTWDRRVALDAIRSCRAALDEIEAGLQATQAEAA